jgi:hypothetical protein
MVKRAKLLFSVLLAVLVALVFTFAFSLSLLLTETKLIGDLDIVNKYQPARNNFSLEVKIYKSEKALTRAINQYLSQDDMRLRSGFSVWKTDGSECTIFVTEPMVEKDFDSWGHELGHCVYGNWHPQKN